MNKVKAQEIILKLRSIFGNPKCFLNHQNVFELVCAVMLSAQTTDERVNMVTPELFAKYPDPYALANASYNDVRNIIRSIGLANTKASNLIKMANVLVNEYNGEVPSQFDLLVKLPGVGRKTANVVSAVGFHIPAIAVDTHVYRTSYRLGFRKEADDLLVAENNLKKYINKEDWIDAHHLLILFGRTYCKAQNPKCDECPLKEYCKVKRGK